MREILYKFKHDYLRVVIAVTNGILAISMFISPEPHNFFFWFTLAFRIATVPTAIFIGNKALWFLYFVFVNVKALDISYNNYTCVAILSILFALTPKVTMKQAVAVASLYITDVFIVAGLHNKSPFYIYTHILLSVQYCTAMWKQKVFNRKSEHRVLILTPEEIKILEQINNGDAIKSIDGGSEATVYRRLTEARKRNNIEDNKKLKELFSKANTGDVNV